MEVADVLVLGAEVSVTFAGFSGIVAAFQFRDGSRVKRGDVVGLTMIVQQSLSCAFFSAFPLLLFSFDINESTVWMIASITGAILLPAQMFSIDKNMRGAVKKRSLILFFGTLQGFFALFVIANILNAADLVFHREPGPYIAAIFAGLGLVGYMFGRLLLRPLWKSVHHNEKATGEQVEAN